MTRARLDKLLVERGLAGSRERARALLMSGVVLVEGRVETKSGTLVDPDVAIVVREPDHPYVSRGALKLAAGLDAFAIDVGYGQLAWSLRTDPRVVVIERQNVRTIPSELVPEPCDLAVIDVSFISLTLVLPRVAELLRPPAGKPIVALVKPQFEVGREHVGKGGVVRDEAARLGAVTKVREWANANGFHAGDHVESPITGPAG